MDRRLLAAALACTVGTVSASVASPDQPAALLERARVLHRQVPMFDGHNDYPWEVRQKAGKDVAKLDIRGRQPATMTTSRACARRRGRAVLVRLYASEHGRPAGGHGHARADRHRPPDGRALRGRVRTRLDRR